MTKRRLNGDGVTYENQGGVLCIDIQVDDKRMLRFIVEDTFSMMAAVLVDGEVLKAQTVDLEEWADDLMPEPEQKDA